MGRPKGSGVTPAEDRFWAKVVRLGYGECWPWTGAVVVCPRTGQHRGKFWVPGEWTGSEREKTCQLAPRIAFYLVHGRWPDPNALHGCDNSLCCNAENHEHVHEGTLKDNTREMFERGRGVLPPVQIGSAAHRSKLTDEQALEIVVRYAAEGVSQAVLALEYGVAQPSIGYIVRGKRRSLQQPSD